MWLKISYNLRAGDSLYKNKSNSLQNLQPQSM